MLFAWDLPLMDGIMIYLAKKMPHLVAIMKQQHHHLFTVLACVLGGVAILVSLWSGIARYRVTRQAAERKEFFARFGIDSDGTREFVALPKALTSNALSARLGEALFVDKRLARSPYRVCGACHRLNEGGIDARALDGHLPRTVYNAIFADVFLHDGSVTGFPALVRHMIESPDHCAGGPLSNVVARLAADEKLRARFQTAYPDGLTEDNILDAFDQYQRTLFSTGLPFDRWCAGRTNALNAVQTRGFDIFRKRKCTDCHYGPALGMLKVADGKKVPGLRGLSQRRAYLPDARVDLGAVLTLMPGGDLEAEDRRALTAFLKTL